MKTPNANRLHIGIFGSVNVGKSSFLNAFTNQDVVLTSSLAGTTSDPVHKAMEVHGIGPVVFIDTAGSEDVTDLSEKRLAASKKIMRQCDVALVVATVDTLNNTKTWVEELKQEKIPYLILLNKIDIVEDKAQLTLIQEQYGENLLLISSKTKQGLDDVKDAILRILPKDYDAISILEGFVDANSLVVLVMPQDIQAPKGRLILPQVQTIREALDKKCMVMCITPEHIRDTLSFLNKQPDLIICDSQIVKEVYEQTQGVPITTFSVLFANYKGDAKVFKEGMKVFDNLRSDAKILIAEACTHAPLEEDIGRVKIPRLLKKKYGDQLDIHIHSGTGFPEDLESYDIIIHCGACMFHRKHVLQRIQEAKRHGVAITNYGMTIAYLQGVMEHIVVERKHKGEENEH